MTERLKVEVIIDRGIANNCYNPPTGSSNLPYPTFHFYDIFDYRDKTIYASISALASNQLKR